MMSLAIMLPAATIYYWQAWCYLAVFFIGVSIITIYIFLHDKSLLQSRLKVGTIAETRKAQKIIQAFASLGFIGMYIVAGFDYRYQWSGMPPIIWIAADGMLILTWALFFVIFKKNTFLSATIEVQQHQHIITDGPYAVVRHPMYAAAILLFIFTPLALGSLWALLSLPLMIIVLVLRCLDEEKALTQQLQGYTAYCKKVPFRLIPFLW